LSLGTIEETDRSVLLVFDSERLGCWDKCSNTQTTVEAVRFVLS